MADKMQIDVRGTLLTVISEQQPKGATDGSLQTGSVLKETARRIGAVLNLDLEQALLTQLHDLFRTGYLAWGYNVTNPSSLPSFLHHAEGLGEGAVLKQQLTETFHQWAKTFFQHGRDEIVEHAPLAK